MAGEIEVRSWRQVYKIDRRIYVIGDFAVGSWIPGGLPARGAGYTVATLALMVVLTKLPGVREVISSAALEPVVYVLLPVLCGWAGMQSEPDGLAPHRWLVHWIRHRLGHKRWLGDKPLALDGQRAEGEQLSITPGQDWPELVPAVVCGPAFVHTRDDVALTRSRRALIARPAAGATRGTVTRAVRLEPGELLEIAAPR